MQLLLHPHPVTLQLRRSLEQLVYCLVRLLVHLQRGMLQLLALLPAEVLGGPTALSQVMLLLLAQQHLLLVELTSPRARGCSNSRLLGRTQWAR